MLVKFTFDACGHKVGDVVEKDTDMARLLISRGLAVLADEKRQLKHIKNDRKQQDVEQNKMVESVSDNKAKTKRKYTRRNQ